MSTNFRRRPVGTGALLATGSQFVTAASGAILGILVARLLGPADTGAFNVLLVSLQLLLTVSMLGMQTGITYYVGNGTWPPAEAFRQVQLAALVLGGGGALIGFGIASITAESVYSGIDLWLVALAFAALPFALSWFFGSYVALARDDYEVFAATAPWQNVSALILVAVLAPFFGLPGAVIALAISHLVTALRVVAWGLRRLAVGATRWLDSARTQLGAAMRFGLATWVPMALQFLNNRADLLILSVAASNATVGRYAIALAVAEIGLLLPRALTTAVFPRVAALDASGDPSNQAMVTVKSIRHSVLMIPVTTALLVIALFAIPFVYGEDFAAATGMGLILVPGVIALGLANVMAATVMGKGRPRYLLYASAIVTPPTLVLYALLIPPLGGHGAALVSTISYTAIAAANAFFFRRVTPELPLAAFRPERADLADYRDLWSRARARLRPS